MKSDEKPTPKLVRLERFIDGQWVVSQTAISLLYPEKYAPRLLAKGKVGRATELDERLQATGQVWGAAEGLCPLCEVVHPGPYNGECIL